VLAFLDVNIVIEWLVFVGVSLAVLAALRPVARRLNRSVDDSGVGSRRLLGQAAVVLRQIPAGGDVGLVRVDREEWRAQSTDGSAIPPGTAVRVADVQGTRVIVAAVDQLSTSAPDELEQ
jgi:membrane protein implicated in regulation of membrane protease activity